MLAHPQGPVVKALMVKAEKVRNQAVMICPFDTGRLRSSITTELRVIDGLPVATVGTNVSYARFVHDGTGIYGPSGQPIRPTSGQFLMFTPKGSRKPVFARQVRGVPPRPFLRDALSAA